jgi:phytoene dehydrogenase-like protein
MAYDWLKGVSDDYDVIVVGSGLGGLTGANCLAKSGHRVLLLEHHYQLGGLATWFTRRGGHIFDISLHGFPSGMIKSCRKYWSREISDSIVQIKDIRFINPQMNLKTIFDRLDFTRILTEEFKVPASAVTRFFDDLRAMNYYDHNPETTGEMFNRYFPGRDDVQRLLMEPISYANGSSLADPAIAYGIVFSNFMGAGVYTFRGGSDLLIRKMTAELKSNGVEIRKHVRVEKILTELQEGRQVAVGVVANGRSIRAKAVLSNAGIRNTTERLVGSEHLDASYASAVQAVRLNSSSCQVYFGVRDGESIPHIGDLVFTSDSPRFSSEELVDFHTRSRTFSVYYPETRPERGRRYTIVASLNALHADWHALSDADYELQKKRLIEESFVALERFIPDIRTKVDWIEAATPRTIERFTTHMSGASFGTKFEGLKVSMDLPKQVPGLYHAGSVGIIMSGWLGTINYGVITANSIDKFLFRRKQGASTVQAALSPD